MNYNYNTSQPELLAGSYNPTQRREEVMSRLNESIAKIRATDIIKELDKTAGWSSKMGMGRGRGRQDVVAMSLTALEDDIDGLEQRIKDYNSEHFTKEYRTCQGLCTNLQTSLDKLDIEGRHELRQKRKIALMKIEELAKLLAGKPHLDGKSCPQCELQHK